MINNVQDIVVFLGRGFRGGSDEKIRIMWLGREIVVARPPPLVASQFFNNVFPV